MILMLAACQKEPTPASTEEVLDEGTGILGTGWANPFPSNDLMQDGRVALRDLPQVAATPLPVDRLAWRDGFSPSQVSVVRLPGIDGTQFPTATTEPGQGSVHVVDLTEGREVRCLAELDAYPFAEEVATIIRPLEAFPLGHRIAVVVTTAAVERPARFGALVSDRPPASLAEVAPHYRALVDELAPFVPPAEIAVAWDFPVGDGTQPLRSAVAQLAPSTAHQFDRVRYADDGDLVVPGAWRVAEGTFTVTDFTGVGNLLDLQADGTVVPRGTAEAQLYVHIPASVKDAPAGTVPVLLFGHGIFGDPSVYLDDSADPSNVIALADELGAIVVGTLWRGLASPDRLVPITVATDFGKFPELTDLLVQGQTNTLTLVDSVADGELFDDPLFLGAQGQPLVDRDRLLYYGISLGGIEGMVLWAQRPAIDHAVFHVGGAMWSTLLERSSNWSAFELLLVPTIENPADRQVLYAASQLWWDAVDPMSFTTELREGPAFVLQESIGDEQVTNLGTEALARSAGLPLLTPSPTRPPGIDALAADLPDGSRALVQFDPLVAPPPVGNRPAPVTHAHDEPRLWPGTLQQTLLHLQTGEIRHFCGTDPCTADNQGEPE